MTYVTGSPDFDGPVVWGGVQKISAAPLYMRYMCVVSRYDYVCFEGHNIPNSHCTVLETEIRPRSNYPYYNSHIYSMVMVLQ